MMKWQIWCASVLLLCTGCEKSVDFDLNETEPKLVVEATIENGVAPVVILTTSLNYFSKISVQDLAASFVSGATVTISDSTTTETLKEFARPLGGGLSYRYYTVDSVAGRRFAGKLGTRYSLNIIAGGKNYAATTTIPNITRRIDSMWWRPVPGDTSGKEAAVIIRGADRKGFGDYVRYWTQRNREAFLPGINSVFDDLVIDGSTYELEVEPGADRNQLNRDDDDWRFKRGDTVTLKLANIDKATFDFWRTMEFTYSSVGNPFSTPVKVINNINGGALGYFGGYAAQQRTLIIPR